ncbi:DUF397 domain-containing protein [Thermomonospora catenispora]|nr:DUF397 domain-containing protein [Thermomonospora catenispora]TNY37514.1 DUF397 domain-containing protein [Thermomonospora catenispora]
MGVRDSKGDPHVVLEFTPHDWSRLLSQIKESSE